jgi:peptidoglycan/xylan/chitin deacetylase (PgdA/CDA1 family)
MDRLCAVSVDLDEIPCYTAIHGLPSPRDDRASAIYRRALPRFAELFADLGAPATFFAVGRDLTQRANQRALRKLAEVGHEIGSHSASHLYDLTRKPRAVIEREVADAADAIEDAVGTRPVGFRAPGYTVTDELLDVLAAEGVIYDSSVFPCPAYFGLKTAAISAITLRGRTSRSIIGDPRVLLAPADPYRVGEPYWRRGDVGLVELPVGVTRDETGRLPYIGTSVVLGGERGARALTDRIIGRPLVNLELHGIDLADADEDDLGFLRPYQPDLRKPLRQKEAALRAALGRLREAGYRFVTLATAARALKG